MPLQFLKFTNLPLHFTYLEIWHYHTFFAWDVPFFTYSMLLGPFADLWIFVRSKLPLLPFFSPLADMWTPHHLLPPSFLFQPLFPSESHRRHPPSVSLSFTQRLCWCLLCSIWNMIPQAHIITSVVLHYGVFRVSWKSLGKHYGKVYLNS